MPKKMSPTLSLVGACLLLAGVAVLVFQISRTRIGPAVPAVFTYSVEQFTAAESRAPHLCRELRRIPLSMDHPRALAAGPGGAVAVVGDRNLLILDAQGNPVRETRLNSEPFCIAWPDERLIVGFADHIAIHRVGGDDVQEWETLGEQAYLTGLAADGERVFAADYGQKTVWIFDADGRLVGRFGRGSGPDSFVMPSPFFDVAIHRESVWATNPGRRRVEEYSRTGQRLAFWGVSSMDVAGFCGCCNPTHIAVMPNGRFVTSEKGLPRVKLYGPNGNFLGVAAGSDRFKDGTEGLDLTVDTEGRILVLDPGTRSIRVLVEDLPGTENDDGSEREAQTSDKA